MTNAAEDSDVKATRLMEFIEVSDPKDAKQGLRTQFMHIEVEDTVYWLEGTIEQRITKPQRTKRLENTGNYFRIGQIKILKTWWDDPKPLPKTVCIDINGVMGWTKLIPKGLPVGRESKLDVGLNGIPTSLEYNEPKDAYIKELKRGRDSTISDDPKRGACGRSNESCRNSIIKVSELKHDVKSNINLPQAEDEYTKWKTGKQCRQLPPGDIASTAHPHFPFPNGDVPKCESYIRDEDEGGQHLEKKKEHFMDDLRKGACSFSEDTANLDSWLLYQSQSHENSQDEDDIERVVIEAAYLDDVIISTTSEEEISKLKRTFPNFLHTSELISKTSVYGNIQEPSQLPSPGFINTASILEESKYRSIKGRNKNEGYKTSLYSERSS